MRVLSKHILPDDAGTFHMKSPLRILHLEDNPLDAELVKAAMEEDGGVVCDILLVETREGFISAINEGGFDIIFADNSLPGYYGLSALSLAKERCPDVPFIFISGTMGEELAIESLKSGAADYVLKDRILRLVPSVLRALSEAAGHIERRKAVKALQESHEQLRNLAAHLQSVREEERTCIARNIHNDLGQSLTALKMDLSSMAKRPPDSSLNEIAEQLKADVDLINTTLQTVRRICAELRPALLDQLGIGAAIEWQAEEFRKRSKIECEVTLDPDDISVDQKLATTLFRTFQESLANVLRHSEATKVKATLTERDDSIVLEISDNGIGITEEQLSKTNAFGLLAMRELVHIWKGEVRITGSHSKGTTVTVIIPQKNKQAAITM
jgi:signal transduction histidine kinase